MKSNVPVAEAINDEAVRPERVEEALGQLLGAAKEGLFASRKELPVSGSAQMNTDIFGTVIGRA